MWIKTTAVHSVERNALRRMVKIDYDREASHNLASLKYNHFGRRRLPSVKLNPMHADSPGLSAA